MIYNEGDEFALADRLEELAAGIVERIGFDPPELKEKLQPPQLHVFKGPPGLNSYCLPKPNGTKVILLGADLYPFCHHYTRAVATYLLPSEPGGPRPSSFWPRACSAVATTLDWLSSPTSITRYPGFELSPHQAHVARAFGDYAYRFALCHEIAHVALGHVDTSPSERRVVGGEEVEVLRASQQQELDADRFGLNLQIKSLPDSTQLITGLASASYFVHITRLLDFRFGMLDKLVDYRRWKIVFTHPPYLHRQINLQGEAEGLHGGSGEGLETIHNSLAPIEGQLYDIASKQQEYVADTTLLLVAEEVSRHAKLLADKTRARSGPDGEPDVPSKPTPDVIRELLQLCEQSPLGVLRALELPSIDATANLASEEAHLRSLVVDQLALELPSDLQRFRRLTWAERAEEMA